MVRALEGITVVDFGRGLPSSLAAMVLADNGADVLHVEPPDGDPDRALPAFRMWRRGQRSITLDLRRPADREQAADLAAAADVVLQNWRPGVAEQVGLDYERLSVRNPGLVYCHITGFGPRGRYATVKGYEGVVAAKAGRYASGGQRFGLRGREGPLFLAAPYASYGAAQAALHGILAALHVRERCGRGQKVETSLVQALTAYDVWDWIIQYMADEYPHQYQVAPQVTAEGVPLSPYFFLLLVAPTKDGRWLQFTNVAPHLWRAFIKCLGLMSIYDDPELKGAPHFQSLDASKRFWDLVIRRLQEKTYEEWMEIFRQDDDVAVEVVRTTQEAMDHPQMQLNRHVVEVDDPKLGRMRQVGPLVTLWETPAVIGTPAPEVGEHNALLGSLTARRPQHDSHGDVPRAPLDGVTVLELGTYFAAPFGLTLLAELGARVIKVEPLEGDPLRFAMPIPESAAAKALQGKESVAVDLNREEGRQIVYQLAKRADLVMCSFRQGVPERLGVDYETLRRINPNLIYLHGVAYGLDGDYPRRPMYGPMPPAITGEMLYQLGEGNLPPPGAPLDSETIRDLAIKLRKVNPGLGDPTAALAVATGMLLALVARDRTGKAQQAMTTMICSGAYLMSDDFLAYAGKPARKLPDGELYGLGALYRLYHCAEDWVFLACPMPDEWPNLCRALHLATGGRVDLSDDPRFASREAREANDRELGLVLAEVFRERTAQDWEDQLLAMDVACVRVNEEPLARFGLRDPIMRENGFVAEVEHFSLGRHLRHGLTVNLSLTPGVIKPACSIGEHTRRVLQELGYAEEDIARLIETGVVRCGDEMVREGTTA
jgi:crotonobetainyl-CoA:carnitine CoA-transferase CaiB-like acyl-CoA transferase